MVTKRTPQLMHLDADRVRLLKDLAAELRLPKSVLMRMAIEELLTRYGKLKKAKRRKP